MQSLHYVQVNAVWPSMIGLVETSCGMVFGVFWFVRRSAVDGVLFVVIGWLSNSWRCAIDGAESESGRSGF